METYNVVQKLQRFITDHDLPKTDIALYGIKCPYCGKSDRIRELEDPDELEGIIDPEDIKTYSDCCVALSLPMGSLGVCKFCQNPLRISVKEGKAEPVYD